MKITTDRDKLSKALSLMVKVADARSTMPILACVRIGAGEDGQARIDATNLETYAHVTVDAKVHKGGSVAADARQLAALVKAASGETVTLKTDSNALRVGAAKMETYHAPDFPKMPAFAAKSHGWTEPSAFAAALAKVLPSVSLDITRFQLCGVYLETDPSAALLRMVATDGHRLTLVDTRDVQYGPGPAQSGILPRAAALIIAGACKRAANLSCALLDGYFHASVDGALLTVKLIMNAQFPPYGAVIPSGDGRRTLIVGREALAVELKKARDVMRAAKREDFNIALGMRGKVARVAAFDDGGGTMFAADVTANYAGESQSFAIGANSDYLIAALATVDDEQVTLDFGSGDDGHMDPIRIISSDGKVTCVVMPVITDKSHRSAATPDEKTAPDAVQEAKQFVEKAKRTRAARKAPAATPVAVDSPVTAPASAAQLLAANVDVAQGLVEAFIPFALLAQRACYRCKHVKPMGYILDGKVCCRDCREAHRVDYYAGRGQVAQPRQRRQRGIEVVQTVGALHVRAEHVTVEAAPMGNA